MGLESATTIAELNANWPLGTDQKSEGDDHLRLIKKVLKTDVVGQIDSRVHWYVSTYGYSAESVEIRAKDDTVVAQWNAIQNTQIGATLAVRPRLTDAISTTATLGFFTKAEVARGGVAVDLAGAGNISMSCRNASGALDAAINLRSSGLDVNGLKVVQMAAPTATTDAANKAYVDGAISTGVAAKAPLASPDFTGVSTFGAPHSATGAVAGTTLYGGQIRTSQNVTTTAGHHVFYNPNGNVGQCETNGSATNYKTSSDEQLKDFIGEYDPDEAIAIIRADPVREYTWKVDGVRGVGWGAQTSYAIDPLLASPPSPPTDQDLELRADRSVEPQAGEPGYIPWGIDYGRRTPYLWAALARALDMIDALELRVAELEAVA